MVGKNNKKPFSSLSENLKSIRRRQLTKDQIERANTSLDRPAKISPQSGVVIEERPKRKIAKQPGAGN